VSPSWSVCAAVWRNAVLGERRNWAIGWTVVATALSALGALLGFAFATSPMARMVAWALPLAALALFYWLRFIPGAVRQNSPANARLVPGLHQAVRRTTVLAWCLTMVPMVLLAWAFERPLLGLVVFWVAVTAIGMARGGRRIGTVIYLLVMVAQALVIGSDPMVAWLSSAPVLAVLMVMCLAMGWDGLRTIFPAGGERHWRMLSAQAQERVSTDLHQSMRLHRAGGRSARLYALLLRRDLRPDGSPRHLLLHALGPYNHRFDVVLPVAIALLLAIALRLVLAALGVDYGALPSELIRAFAVPLVLCQGLMFERMVVSMNNTRVEQALVRLAPRSPQADCLGRTLARQLLAICLVEWLASGLVLVAMLLLFGAGWQHMMIVASAMSVSLAAAGWALRDYSVDQSGAFGAEAIVQTLLLGAGGVALFLVRDNTALWSALLVLMVGSALAVVHGRWKTMVEAPVPFPAGRAG
jgi:hypothetical protein